MNVEARVRYHADGVTVRVPIDDAARAEVHRAVVRARELRCQSARPPVTREASRCARCSLAPVCLPEEDRLAKDPDREPLKLGVRDDEREIVHVTSHGARIGRSSDEIEIVPRKDKVRLPIHQVRHVVVHGSGQVSTQALHLCVEHDVAVSWITNGGRFVGTLAATGPTVHRRVRQYEALSDGTFQADHGEASRHRQDRGATAVRAPGDSWGRAG